MDDSTLLLVTGSWDVAGLVQFLMNEASTTKQAASMSPLSVA